MVTMQPFRQSNDTLFGDITKLAPRSCQGFQYTYPVASYKMDSAGAILADLVGFCGGEAGKLAAEFKILQNGLRL